MQKISKFLNKNANQDVEKWVEKLDAELKQILPKSFIQVRFVTRLGKSIQVDMTLGKDRSEWANGIEHNDPLRQTIFIWAESQHDKWPESGLPEKLKAENSGGTLLVKPAPGSFYAFDRVKLGWRNKTGTPDVIFKYIVDYVKKVKNIITENNDKLPYENIKNKY